MSSDWSALYPLRVGCVQYLNARPLIHGYDGAVVYDHPSGLAAQLARGELDVGLVPIFEALGARHYPVVDGVAIACDGEVYSVFLAYRGELGAVRSVKLDPASLTSVHLLKVLLAEYHQLEPKYIAADLASGGEDAELLIGNQAIDFRRANGDAYRYLDLGAEWLRCTGLPFVFALWMLRPALAGAGLIADAFRRLQAYGQAHLEEVLADPTFYDREFRERYLTTHIRFGLGAREKAAMEKFAQLLAKHGFVSSACGGWLYI